MSFEIAQNRGTYNRARRVRDITELSNVRLTALVARTDFPGGQPPESLRLRIKFTSKALPRKREGFSAQVRFDLTGSKGEKDSNKPLLDIRCSFHLDYSLPPDSAIKPSEIRAFAKSNAIFNGWPYFREIVQNTCARLGLSPPPVPLLKFKIVAPKQNGQKEIVHARR